jgi:hypothetical protein
MRLSRNAIAAAVVLAAAAVQAPQAHAASSVANAVGSCQGSLSMFDANLRKRPLGIQNVGTTSVFVSCGVQWAFRPGLSPQAYVTATNLNATAVDLTCTLLDGYPVVTRIAYHPKTISIAANSSASIIWLPWEQYDIADTFTNYENFSCHVPPGIEINRVGFDYTSYDAWNP